MTCEKCSRKNDFPYEFCCLHECGEHIFCVNCENLNKCKDFEDCEDKRVVESIF